VSKLKSGSTLERLLDRGEFVVTAELGPPRSVDPKVLDDKISALKDSADAINITDNQTSIVRVSSIAAAAYLVRQGLEPVVQVACRDRNRIAIQSDLLGAALSGVKNILCITGDHQCFGDHPQAKQVYDIDSVQLIQMVRDMRDRGVFQGGQEIRNSKKAEIHEPRFLIGAVENPFADPMEWRVSRLEKKVNAGADFIQTQCVYDMERFAAWMREVVERGLHSRVKILAGLTPIRSLGMLKHMKENVAGIAIPDSLAERLGAAKDIKAEGLRVCLEQIERLRAMEGVAGIHLMTVEWEAAVPQIVGAAGLLPRPKAA